MTLPSLRPPVRRTARQREERRIRIMAMVRSGFSYEAIARDENLSRERIRQIVTESLKAEGGPNRLDHNRLQIARLDPALRLAARGVENGKLNAIVPLLKVLERLDTYGAVVGMVVSESHGARAVDEEARRRREANGDLLRGAAIGRRRRRDLRGGVGRSRGAQRFGGNPIGPAGLVSR